MRQSAGETGVTKPLLFSNRTENHIAKAILLEEAAPPTYWKRTVSLITFSTCVFIIWACVAELDVVATATGQIMPIDSVKIIQHVDGGRISSIDVLDGQEVKKGQVLMRLNSAEASAEYQTLSAKYWMLWARIERLRALLGSRRANFSKVPGQYAEIIKEHEITLKASKEQITELETEIALLTEISAIRSELAQERLATRVQALEAKRNLSQAQAELMRFRKLNMDDLNTSTAELAQTDEQMHKLRDRMERMEILSPIDGVIQDLKYRTLGGVVTPGAILMNVIPLDGKLQAEIRVQPIDIGFVRIDEQVRVKITTYDFMRYGTIIGQVNMVSSYSSLDEKQNPYFKVIVSLPQNYVSNKEHAINPGMTVQADIITDRQTVLRYLLRPIFVALSQGMRER